MRKEGVTLWAVLEEDTYETSLGDGYYAYLAAIFRLEAEAVNFARRQSREWRRWHVRRYAISWDCDGKLAVSPGPILGENITPAKILNLARHLG